MYHWLQHLMYYTKKSILFYPNLVFRKKIYKHLTENLFLRAKTTEKTIIKKTQKITSFFLTKIVSK